MCSLSPSLPSGLVATVSDIPAEYLARTCREAQFVPCLPYRGPACIQLPASDLPPWRWSSPIHAALLRRRPQAWRDRERPELRTPSSARDRRFARRERRAWLPFRPGPAPSAELSTAGATRYST